MVWPKIAKKDALTLCEPFSSELPIRTQKEKGFAGVIFFDVGSVLIDLDWESFYQGLNELLSKTHQFSLEKFLKIMREENLNSIWSQGKLSTLNYVDQIHKIIKLSSQNPQNLKLTTATLKQVDSLILGNPRKLVLDLVNKLKQKNFVVCLLSNTTPWHVQLIYERIQSTKNFDLGIYSCDVGYEKPHPKIFEIAFEEASSFVEKKFKNKLQTNEIYFVDDTPENIRAAQTCGWNARLVNLLTDEVLEKVSQSEFADITFEQESQKRKNLLFAEEASLRINKLFRNLLK